MSNIYLNELNGVVADDVAALRKAEKSYGDSWKKRGGVGAFMMLARKWDRLENHLANASTDTFNRYDIFAAVCCDRRPEGVIDDIRDLRRYLVLVEAELRATGRCPGKLAKDAEEGWASKGGSKAVGGPNSDTGVAPTPRIDGLADGSEPAAGDGTPPASALHPA